MPEKANKNLDLPENATLYVCDLNDAQIRKLRELLLEKGWELSTAPHAYWKASSGKMNAVAYLSGKLVVQGKGAGELALYTIEPEITGEPKLGYEDIGKEKVSFEPHAGIDESGKGDLFGALCIASVYVDKSNLNALEKLGVKDSKKIKSDAKIAVLARKIMGVVKGDFSIVVIGPESYNKLYTKIENLNRILAWGHSRALENLLEKKPDIKYAISDKFGNERLIKNALMKKGKKIELRQEVRAESDIAVAAASILARNAFLESLKKLSEKCGVKIPKGVGKETKEVLKKLFEEKGEEFIRQICKLHFKTVEEVLGRKVEDIVSSDNHLQNDYEELESNG